MARTRQAAVDPEVLSGQQNHWDAVLSANPDMYGTDPSEPALAAAELFASEADHLLLELGAGQGRDTLYFARRGFRVHAFDYALSSVEAIAAKAQAAHLADAVTIEHHDIRRPLPLAEASVDACYSHMLFCMALTTAELVSLVAELERVVRPGGPIVYTVRTTADAHYGTGTARGDNMYEHGGFIVHFFDRRLIDQLATAFELVDVTEFTEGDLPRRLARITMRVTD